MIRRCRSAVTGGALAAILIASGIGLGAAGAPAATANEAEVDITDGTFEWGVRQSIRNYLENFDHTDGWVAASDGASYEQGDLAIRFSGGTGTVDETAGTAELAFDGAVEMFGFGEYWLWFENLRLDIDGTDARLTADIVESWSTPGGRDDVLLAIWPADETTISVSDGGVSLQFTDGHFGETIGTEHLPQLGDAPTYGPPNDHVDNAAAVLTFDGSTPDPEPTDPEPTDPEPTDPAPTPSLEPEPVEEDPYGVSIGSPLTDSSAYITVTPGYALNPEGGTVITIEGWNFHPGNATEPGTGSGGLYVGLGQAADPDSEQWRRSNGGLSGPGGDFDYGSPRFVAHYNTADGDVADAQMDANGNWSFDIEVPGSSLPSFFGGAMDCLVNECGVFAFGAHGVVNRANEAYTPIHFVGEDESNWPPRGNDGERPTEDPNPMPTVDDLTGENRGSVSILSNNGIALSVEVDAQFASQYLGAVFLSDGIFAGWHPVNSAGRFNVPLNALSEGEHRLVLVDAQSRIIGWAPFTHEPADNPDPDPDDDLTPIPGADKNPNGESTGTNSYGASLTVSPAYELEDENQLVTLTGEGYPTTNASGQSSGGVYVLFGWIDPDAGSAWGPSERGRSGFEYVYVEGEENQTMVLYPGSGTMDPGDHVNEIGVMDEQGDWEIEFAIPLSQFTAFGQQIDCYAVQCGVITIGAHGQANADAEVFTPVYFDADGSSIDPNARPTPVDGTQTPGGSTPSGNGIGTDIVQATNEGRTMLFVALLIVATGVFGMAIVWVLPRNQTLRN